MRIFITLLICVLTWCNADAQKKKGPKPTLARADSVFMTGDYAKAIPLYEAVLKDPKIATQVLPWYRLAVSYHNGGDFTKALAAYAKAEKINPRQQGLRLNMAKAFSASGDVANAKLRLDSVLASGFGNHKLLAQDPDFENLRKSELFKSIEDRAYANSHPCASLPAAHAFDFWLGDWDVFLTSNLSIKTGFNSITSRSGGCVILENWEAQGPHTGMSLNYFDPTSNKWQQKWAGSGQDIQEFYDGEYTDGAMRFKWDGTNPDGTKFMGKLTFSNLPNGNVRQHSESSSDGGKTWADVYDFTYVKRK